MFSKALVKTPAKSMTQGISEASLGVPNYQLALIQHKKYIQTLEDCGLEVTVLPADEAFPDSCFVEDPAVVTPQCVIITNPGATSRNDETEAIKKYLSTQHQHCYQIKAPGTLDGGDVMMVGTHFYIGLSARTNLLGAKQFIDFLTIHQYTGSVVTLNKVLHLKTGLSYLEHNCLLVSGEFVDCAEFNSFDKIKIPESESYAANCIWVNGIVIIPAGHLESFELIKRKGYKVITADVSEFQKLDGGLSCLSLRY